MLSEITGAQFDEWLQFEKLEPFGFQVDNLMFGATRASIAATIPSKHHRIIKPQDFMLSTDDAMKEQSPESILEFFKQYAAQRGDNDLD